MKRLIALLLAAASIAFVAAGCGGGGGGAERLSKQEYQQQVRDLGKSLQARFGDFTNVNPTDVKSLSDLFTKLGGALNTAADEFSKLKPPVDVQGAQDKLVSAVRELADKSRELAGKVKNAKLSDLAQLQNELDISKSEAFAKLQEALNEFKSKGYSLGSLGS